jgi:outer membrane protein TolC
MMRFVVRLGAALLLMLAVVRPAAAQVAVAPLTLEEVLASSARFSPQIVETLARVRAAEGRALAAEGAFDTVFDVDAKSRVTGYYDGTYVDARASRPLATNGGALYGGYSVSRGDFPTYEDERFTNRLGEIKVGGVFALMRDRLVDARRTGLTLAAGDIDLARLDRELVAIGVQRRAIEAYQNWVAAGLRLRIYRELLTLADERRSGIVRQAQLGARPEILVVENDQNIVRRRSLVTRAEQDLALAANSLSLYLRDAGGEPIVPSPARLPAALPTIAASPVPQALPDRPDLRTLLVRIDQSFARLALAENELKPRLDVRGELANDFGSSGLGGRSRNGVDTIVGVKFSLPLQRRAARGRIAEVRAEIDALGSRRKLIEDQIRIEVNNLGTAAAGATQLAELAAEEAVLATRMAAAERRRFELGASDFFLVNLREEAATDARIRALDAQARVAAARAELGAATVDRRLLGLEER